MGLKCVWGGETSRHLGSFRTVFYDIFATFGDFVVCFSSGVEEAFSGRVGHFASKKTRFCVCSMAMVWWFCGSLCGVCPMWFAGGVS